ncbi:hypothetical protein [Streptomyces sp. H27-D2]|uniref:hypothetical protein n=1 Tax=Streptomyces sp. H27-D2 TaxID=3046304 RepID=UPI002DBEA839|nr:hypothetical protein [Streptomyces sp. H27-D2]MEC4015468.1 hypothetical protein [Streptomyces sp. H27-D2]
MTTPGTSTSTLLRPGARRATLRVLSLWIALIATLVGVGSATAEPSAAPTRQVGLTGTWDVSVTVGTGPDASTGIAHFVFRPDHKLTAEVDATPGGAPGYRATGYWNAKNDKRIAFYVTHPGSADSSHPGVVQAVHMGKVSGRTFTTTAVAFAVNTQDGSTQGPITVSTEATRTPAGHRAR